MQHVATDQDCATIRLDGEEWLLVNNSLNEVSNMIRIPDSEFQARLGGTRQEARRLLAAIRSEVQALYPGSERPRARHIGPDGLLLRFAKADLILLRNALIEVTKGDEIPDWEFPIRLRVTVAEGKELLAEVERVLAEWPAAPS